ncbi:MAG: hypothetical protein GX600_04200 [Dehalococcoidia bacterium]|nr:hypothetical protein [Dehalococcoidia bacterium]
MNVISRGIRVAAQGVIRLLRRAVGGVGAWQEFHLSATHRSDATVAQYQYLRAHGIRCQLRSLWSPSVRGVSNVGMVSLRVHRDDVAKAYRLLAGQGNDSD